MMNLKGQVAVVTGGGRGMGKAAALRLAEDGAALVVIDVNGENARLVAEEIVKRGGEAIGLQVDVSNSDEVKKAFAKIDDRFGGRIDILVNAAGIQRVAGILEETEEVWDKLMAVNTKGTFLCCQEACKRMIPRRYGRIINFGSSAGLTGVVFMLSYSASKFGVIGFTQALALEVGKYGITVNAVCPGAVDTEMWRDTREGFAERTGVSAEDQLKQTAESIPLGRVGQVDDIAKVIRFLVSDDASYVTAQAISVCGGIHPH
ncbi:MAG TPA: SDR family oxidoreductase [Firmicutes bacterium]|nr:SDR family oxidoreductase [Bacillota bacterium]